MNKVLILLRGLPGSGKTTVAEYLSERLGNVAHFEADQFLDYSEKWTIDKAKEAHKECYESVEQEMGRVTPTIIVANTFTQEWEMEPYKNLAKQYGYVVFSLIVENYHNGTSIHDVPSSTLDKMRNRFVIKL